MGEKKWILSGFEGWIVADARLKYPDRVNILETADLLGFSLTTMSWLYLEWTKTKSKNIWLAVFTQIKILDDVKEEWVAWFKKIEQ